MPVGFKSVRAKRDDVEQCDLAPLGLRERHKIAKIGRISNAAIKLFSRDGYDGTTLRDIAREADVALGTLSLYARDKRDLVLMIFNSLIPPLLEAGRRNIDCAAPIADNMIAFYDPCYRAYAENPTLYRTVLGQIYNGAGSVHAEENDAIRIEILRHMSEIIQHAVASGECRPDLDIAVQSRAYFYVYFTAVRVWLFQDDPDPVQGQAALRALFDVIGHGCEQAR